MGKKVLLYSGGMDSWLISKIWEPDVKIYVDMHTRYSAEEILRLPSDVIVVDFPLGQWERPDAIIPLRNLYLVMVATNYGDEICLGATAGDRVLDKSFMFADKASDLLSYLYSEQHWTEEREIKINLDFKSYTKKQLIEEFISKGGDINDAVKESFSCYNPLSDGTECWSCKPCFRKYVSFKSCGYDFEPYIDELVYNYLAQEIIPQINAGEYGRGLKEEEDIVGIYESLTNSRS